MESQENECNPVVAAAGPQGNKAVKFRTGFCVLEIAPPTYERFTKLQEIKEREDAKKKADREAAKKRREAVREKWLRDHPANSLARPGGEELPPVLEGLPEFEEGEAEEGTSPEPPPALDYHKMPNEYLAGMVAKPLQDGYVALLTDPDKLESLSLARTDKQGNLIRIEQCELGGPVPSSVGRTVLFDPDRTYWCFWSYDRELFEKGLAQIGTAPMRKRGLFSFKAQRTALDLTVVKKFLSVKGALDHLDKKEEMNRLATLIHNLQDGLGLLSPRTLEATNRRTGEPEQPFGTNFKGSRECDTWVYARRPGIAATFLTEFISNLATSIHAESAWNLQQIRTAHQLASMANAGQKFPALEQMIIKDIKNEPMPYWKVLLRDTERYVDYARQCGIQGPGYMPGTLFGEALPDMSSYQASGKASDGTQEFFEIDQPWRKAADTIQGVYHIHHPAKIEGSPSSESIPSRKRKNWKPLSPKRRTAIQGYFDFYQYGRYVQDPKRPEYRDGWFKRFPEVEAKIEDSAKDLQLTARELLERFAPTKGVWLEIAWHVKGGLGPPDERARDKLEHAEESLRSSSEAKGEGGPEEQSPVQQGAAATVARKLHIEEPRLLMHARFLDAVADVGHLWWNSLPGAGSPEFEEPTYREAIKKGFENAEKMSELLSAWFQYRSKKYMSMLEAGLRQFASLKVKMDHLGEHLLGTPTEELKVGQFTFRREKVLTHIKPGAKLPDIGPTAETFLQNDGTLVIRQHRLVIDRGSIAMTEFPYMPSEIGAGNYRLDIGHEVKAGKTSRWFEKLKGAGKIYCLDDGVLRGLTAEEYESLRVGEIPLHGRAELYGYGPDGLRSIEPENAVLENQELFKKMEEDCQVSFTRVPRFMVAFATTVILGFALWEFITKKQRSARDVFELSLNLGVTVQTVSEACEVFQVRIAGTRLEQLLKCGLGIGKLLGAVGAGWEVIQVIRQGALVLMEDKPFEEGKGRRVRARLLKVQGWVTIAGGVAAILALVFALSVPLASVFLAVTALFGAANRMVMKLLGEYQSFMDVFDKQAEIAYRKEVVAQTGTVALRLTRAAALVEELVRNAKLFGAGGVCAEG